MDKFSFISLWDIYGGLLTDWQTEITNMYFNLDLTVSEIAEEKGISRQAVSDCMKTCKKQLEDYENKLHLFKRLSESSCAVSCLMTDVTRWAENFGARHPEMKGDISELKDILNKDYTAEVYGRRKTGED